MEDAGSGRGPRSASGSTGEPVTFSRRGEWLWRAWLVVVVLVMGGLWFVALRYGAGPHHAVPTASSARALPGHRGQAASARPSAAAKTAPGAAAARTLTPVSVAAFGPRGAGQGDNSDLASLAIDANPATAWRTDWYATARFGNLYPGTGLLVDMGRPVTIKEVRITLGSAAGASLQIRVGSAPTLASLQTVAHMSDAGGVVHLRISRPTNGRYVLVWFTQLPPDSTGTFRESVYGVQLRGRT
jgi:hypothetical protein